MVHSLRLLQSSLQILNNSSSHVINDWKKLFKNENIPDGHFNDQLLKWINARLNTSYTSLTEAKQAFARNQGVDRWKNLKVIPPKKYVICSYMHNYVHGAIPDFNNLPDVRITGSTYDTIYGDLTTSANRNYESQWFTRDFSIKGNDGVTETKRDLDRMANIGINAAALLIAPTHLPTSLFTSSLQSVCEAAVNSTTKMIPELWISNRTAKPNYTTFGQNIYDLLKPYNGCHFHIDGKPVIGVVDQTTPEGELSVYGPTTAELEQLFAPWGGLSKVYYIATCQDWHALDNPSVSHPYLNDADANGFFNAQDDWNHPRGQLIVDLATATNKELVYPVAQNFYQKRPGNQSNFSGLPWEYSNSFGGTRLINVWNKVLTNSPRISEIWTWNDFSEDTALMPTNVHGETYIDITKYFIGVLRGSTLNVFDKEQVMIFHPRQLVNATVTDSFVSDPNYLTTVDSNDYVSDNDPQIPTYHVKNHVWRNTAPTIDYISIVTMLHESTEIELTVGTSTWTRTMPAGLQEWLIIAALPNPRAIGDTTVIDSTSYPTTTSTRYVQNITSFQASIPSIVVKRNNVSIATGSSIAPFLNSVEFQDMTVIGTAIEL